MNNPKRNLSMASLWFETQGIEHRVFDGKIYLIVKDITDKDVEIQISNAEVNERARLGSELISLRHIQ